MFSVYHIIYVFIFQSDPKGFIVKDNGAQIAAYKWKCKSVSGQFALTGWTTNWYDDSSWGGAEVRVEYHNETFVLSHVRKIYR